MWIPDFLHISNLMSHMDSTFKFVKGRVVMIKGKNDYDRVPKSNGAGKSVFIEGLSIAFTGDFIRKIPTDQMIKDGSASGSVEFQMHNTMTKQVMNIKRTIFRSKTKYGSLSITMNNVPVEFAKVDHGSEWILKEIGITKDDLFNYYIISKKKYKSFFYSTDGDKRKLISRFSKADMVDGVYAEIAADVKVIEDDIKNLEQDKNIINGRISVYEEQLNGNNEEESEEELILELQVSIDDKEEAIKNAEIKIKENGEKLKALKLERKPVDTEIDKAEKDLIKIKPRDFKKDKDKLNKLNEEYGKEAEAFEEDIKFANETIDEIKKKITPLQQQISGLDKQLIDFIDCPKCAHKFSFKDAKLDIKSINKDKKDLQAKIDAFNKDITNADTIIIEIDEDVKQLDAKIDDTNKKLRALEIEETNDVRIINNKKREISALQTKISGIELIATNINSSNSSSTETIRLAKESIKELKAEIEQINNREKGVDPAIAIKANIEKAKLDMEKIDLNIIEKNKVKASKAKWTELYKRFNVKLSNMAIKSIEGLANDIQYKMGSNLELAVEGYKINRDGSVSDQISTQVLRYGILEGTFFRFSEGEQGSMNISATMAMQQLINMGCKSGGLDMTFIDEITESLDSAAMASVVRSLDMLGRTIVIITHVSDENMVVPNELTIVKTSEGSKILENDID